MFSFGWSVPVEFLPSPPSQGEERGKCVVKRNEEMGGGKSCVISGDESHGKEGGFCPIRPDSSDSGTKKWAESGINGKRQIDLMEAAGGKGTRTESKSPPPPPPTLMDIIQFGGGQYDGGKDRRG
ncbi:hypothetical protein niasHT_007631 [Heterodera trifolii]|uniref:Uncharacterized protein n=1 Tax=Heterodera trifolii TaxID=157864 RepID=A0ABD2LPR0_9BILA